MEATRLYAQVTGVVLLLLGIVGLFAGGRLFGILNIELAEDIIHLLAAAVALYAGFGERVSIGPARAYARIFGAIYLLLGILGFIVPNLFGLLGDRGYTIYDNIVHLALGAIGLFVGFAAGSRGTTRV